MKFVLVYVVFAILAFGICNANKRRGTGRIVGGLEIKQNERKIYKHQVGLLINDRYWCGGSIISKNCIITAAHCLYQMSSAIVYLGLYDKYRKAEAAQVIEVTTKNWIIHPGFDLEDVQDDLAIINLPEPIQFGQFVGPIEVECDDKERHDNEILQVSGWGKYSDSPSDETTILRAAEVQTTSDKKCKVAFSVKITPSMICVDGKDKVGVCKGDSGGPIVSTKSGRLLGVGSFTTGGCVQSNPRVFTRLSSYAKWIQDNTIDHINKC